jgi:hypothetical protein
MFQKHKCADISRARMCNSSMLAEDLISRKRIDGFMAVNNSFKDTLT